jgi:hypothetical protein
MQYDEQAFREAYRRGAHEAYDSAMIGMEPCHARAIEEWLSDLDAWKGGDPPPAPIHWTSDRF